MRYAAVALAAMGCVLRVATCLGEPSGKPASLPPSAESTVDFDRSIRPIFVNRCYACHGPSKQHSGFRLDRRVSVLKGGDSGEPAVTPGQSDKSPLILYVADPRAEIIMPPNGQRLSTEEIGLLRAWIDQGAKMPEQVEVEQAAPAKVDHWSYRPLQEVQVPSASGSVALNAVDAFVLAKLKEHGLSLSAPADRATLIRRLFFDMLGLPPSPAEIEQFSSDPHPDAYERLVERVLASPHYGERWARHWLDVVRFAETDGFEMNQERPNAYHYRDYVIRALNEDKPYNKFIEEQLAGDALGEDAATGFLVGGPYDKVKSPDPVLTSQQRQDELTDMVNTTGTAFLAMTIGCARCHDHKFDPISQTDFYAMQAVFAGVQHGERAWRAAANPLREKQANELRAKIDSIEQDFAALKIGEDTSMAGNASILDEEAGPPRIALLAQPAGQGVNGEGKRRGERDDPGAVDRVPNLSGARYTWWQAGPLQNVVAYRPGCDGSFRIWISWGCGFPTHAADARYLLDSDGDPATTGDQRVIATVDQRHFNDGAACPEAKPLWSGLYDAGVHALRPTSSILVQNGMSASAVTADVLVFQAAAGDAAEPILPRLRASVDVRRNTERISPTQCRFVRMTILSTNNGSQPCIDELEVFGTMAGGSRSNLALATSGAKATSSGDLPGFDIHKLAHLTDGQYGNNRSWISSEAGRGWVQIELPRPAQIDEIAWGRDREGQFADRLATEYVVEVAEEPGQWRKVAGSYDRLPLGTADQPTAAWRLAGLPKEDLARVRSQSEQLRSLRSQLESLSTPTAVYAGVFQQPAATYRLGRGDPMQPREEVAPDAISCLREWLGSLQLQVDAPEQQRRLALARWIARADNPLTPRVMVNRIWHYHFGTGIVGTPSDFGRMGMAPTHPELLDWLSREFVRSGWSLKHMHRLILLSATYRQAAIPRTEPMSIDAGNQFLWRFSSRRLEAEAIRDSILVAAGVLDLQRYGPGFSAFEPNENYVRVYNPRETWGPAQWRRMVYMQKVRMQQDGTFGAFDCPDAGQVAPKRARSTTGIQALNLLNSSFMTQQSQLFAERVQREAGSQPADQVRQAFRLALGRAPDAAETETAHRLVAAHGLAALCRALLNANEFVFVP